MKPLAMHTLLTCWIAVITACGMGETITTTVEVVSEEGEPIPGALVHIAYPTDTPAQTRGAWSKELSNEHGIYAFSAKVYSQVVVAVEKEGYYRSLIKPEIMVPDSQGYRKPVDTHVKITLREIRDPVPMYARQLDMDLLVVGEPIGFDLFVHDWVAPHGKGTHVDLLFELGGSFRDRIDQDSTLRLVFPGQGNGMIAFDRSQYADSEFKSPYMAPADGYNNEWIFRKTRYPNPDRRAGQPSVIVEGEYELIKSG